MSDSAGPGLRAVDAASDLPEAARERLAANAATWTSDLSVSELAVLRRAGFEPLGMVVGMTVYQIALQGYGWGYSTGGLSTAVGGVGYGRGMGGFAAPGVAMGGPPPGYHGYWHSYPCPHIGIVHQPGFNYEDQLYERAISDAFALAVGRLLEEAAALGAHGVVGVRHTQRRIAVSASAVPTLEVKLVGTAVHRPGAKPLAHPFSSHLSGQDFVKLLVAGFVPAGLVIGVGAVRSFGGCVATTGGNYAGGEFRQHSDAVGQSRHLAIAHLERSASDLGDQVVGVAVRATVGHGGEDSLLGEMLAVGTAVRRYRAHRVADPPMVVRRLVDS